MDPSELTLSKVLNCESPMARTPYTLNIPSLWTATRPNGSPLTNGSVADGLHSEETCSGVARHKPMGWLEPTPYSLIYRSYRRAQGVCLNVPNPGNLAQGQKYSGCVGASRFNSFDHFNALVSESEITDGTLSNQALICARVKMKQTKVNLGVAYAERNRTAMLLGDTASRIGKAFVNLRRGRVRSAMNDLGISSSSREPRGSNVPKKWLELQYGWKPLVSDVFGACDALSRRDQGDWRITASCSRSSRRDYTKAWSSVDLGLGSATADTGAFVRIDALPSNDLTISLASLGVTNPLLIAWELVPFSFVVDWALPVGAWLESIDAMLGYANTTTSISVLTRAQWRGNGTSSTNPITGAFIKNDYEEWKKVVKLARTTFIGVPQASFPSIKDPRSLGHMANGLALLSQAFGRR